MYLLTTPEVDDDTGQGAALWPHLCRRRCPAPLGPAKGVDAQAAGLLRAPEPQLVVDGASLANLGGDLMNNCAHAPADRSPSILPEPRCAGPCHRAVGGPGRGSRPTTRARVLAGPPLRACGRCRARRSERQMELGHQPIDVSVQVGGGWTEFGAPEGALLVGRGLAHVKG